MEKRIRPAGSVTIQVNAVAAAYSTKGGGRMEDGAIIELYFARDQRAIEETGLKYGAYLTRVAVNVLDDREDAEECVNDTYLGAWRAMPPHRPQALRAFLGKLTRRISLNRLRERLAGKRGGGEALLALEELQDLIPAGSDPMEEAELRELTRALDSFLEGLPQPGRDIFLLRYWYFDSPKAIARLCGKSESAVKSSLHRTREKLRDYLKEEEWI